MRAFVILVALIIHGQFLLAQETQSDFAKRWEVVLRTWKDHAPINTNSRIKARVNESAGKSSTFSLDFYADRRHFLSSRSGDNGDVIEADNPSYSMILNRVPNTTKYSIGKVSKNTSGIARSVENRIAPTFGGAARFWCLPILWKPLAHLSDPDYIVVSHWEDNGEFTYIEFEAAKPMNFAKGSIKLRNKDAFAPVEMKLSGPGVVLSRETVEMWVKQGKRDAEGNLVTMKIAGVRSADSNAVFTWTYENIEGRPQCSALSIDGNMYSKMRLEFTPIDQKVDGKMCYLMHYGIAE